MILTWRNGRPDHSHSDSHEDSNQSVHECEHTTKWPIRTNPPPLLLSRRPQAPQALRCARHSHAEGSQSGKSCHQTCLPSDPSSIPGSPHTRSNLQRALRSNGACPFRCKADEDGRFWLNYVQAAQQDDLSDEGVQKVYTGNNGNFWVVLDSSGGNDILGCVGVEQLSPTLCELRRMSVGAKVCLVPGAVCESKQGRRRGIGQMLIWCLEEWAVQHGFTQVMLTTGSVMAPAKALYLAAGYEMYEERQLGSPLEVKQADGSTKSLDFSQLAFRKPLTSNHGRWTWVPQVYLPSAL